MKINKTNCFEAEIPPTRIQPPRAVKKKIEKIVEIATEQLSYEPIRTNKKRKIDLTEILSHCSQDFNDLFKTTLVEAKIIPSHIRESVELLKSVIAKDSLEGLSQYQVEKILEAATYFQIHSLRKKAIVSLELTVTIEKLPELFLLAKNNSCPEILLNLIVSDHTILNHKEFPPEFFNNFVFMRDVIIQYPPAVYLVGESLKENLKAHRILVMEALGSIMVYHHNRHEHVFEWAEELFPEKGIQDKTCLDITKSIEQVLSHVGDWEQRPSKNQVEEVQNQIWQGIMEISYLQFNHFVEHLKEQSQYPAMNFVILPLHSLALSLNQEMVKQMAQKCVAFDPTDEWMVRWASLRHPQAILAANTSDPEFKKLYLTAVKQEALLKHDIITSPYFPKELFDDFDFMKQLLSQNPFLHTFLGEKLQSQREELLLFAIQKVLTNTLTDRLNFHDQGKLLVQLPGKLPILFSEFRSKLSATSNSLLHQKFPLPNIFLGNALSSKNLETVKDIFSNIGENFEFTAFQAIDQFLPFLRPVFSDKELDKIIINKLTAGEVFLDAKVDLLADYTSKKFAKAFLDVIVNDLWAIQKILFDYATKNPKFIQTNDVLKYLLDDLEFVSQMIDLDPSLYVSASEKLRTEKKAELEQALVTAVCFKVRQEFAQANDWALNSDGELTLQKVAHGDFITYRDVLKSILTRYGLTENVLCQKLPLSAFWALYKGAMNEELLNWLIYRKEVEKDLAQSSQRGFLFHLLGKKMEYFKEHEFTLAQLRTELRQKIFTYIGKNFIIGDRYQAQLLIPELKLLFPYDVDFATIDEKALAEATSPEFAHDFFSVI